MAKAKMKQAVIPKFSSEAEEAAWWDAHRSEIEAEIRQRMKQKRPLTLGSLLEGEKPSQPVTLRIATTDLETARRLAARKGVGYQTYIKMLLREALLENASDDLRSGIHGVTASSRPQFKTTRESSQEIRFQSYNPYESVYPGLRVVSRETLHLIKTLRTQGYSVVVEPDDGTKLNYSVEKGVREILTDPIYALVIQIPLSLMLNMIANWLCQLKRPHKPDDVNLILEFDEDGNKVRYSESGRPVSDEKFKSILSALETRKRRFEESRKLTPPDPEYFFPIHLEHTGKVVGWSKGLIFNDQKGTMEVDTARILDDEAWNRIEGGELTGFSMAGIVSTATCLICGEEYVDCNHIAGTKYDGVECTVRLLKILPAEISIVKDPVQPLARIKRG
jgi:predicted DNA binding CopG/RHH family protein